MPPAFATSIVDVWSKACSFQSPWVHSARPKRRVAVQSFSVRAKLDANGNELDKQLVSANTQTLKTPQADAQFQVTDSNSVAEGTDEGLVRIRRAIISVSNKSSLTGLGKLLAEKGVEIISTGGTYKVLNDAGVPVREVAEYTGFPEMMDGRVKTLHPKIHGALLSIRGNENHVQAMDEHGILPIDLVVVNLYPFEETVEKGKTFEECVENIDVGGPSMVRGAAKNFRYVTVVTEESQYYELIAELEERNACTTAQLRKRFAGAAFSRLAAYDASVANRFAVENGDRFPQRLLIPATKKQSLRYGENPHQSASFYNINEGNSLIQIQPGVATAEQVQGKELSYNNITDTDAAFELVSEFVDEPVCAIIKHANPCGVAVGVTAQDAYLRALASDPLSAFGGVVALNVTVDKHVAEEITKVFTEVVIAPDASEEAFAILSKKKNLRVLLTGQMPKTLKNDIVFKSVGGGVLAQTRDNGSRTKDEVRVESKRAPSEDEMKNLLFAWKVCKHVKSNAIVYAKNLATVGTGAGQMSRVDASRIAAWKADEASSQAEEDQSRTIGCVVASDAFFPFADGLLAAANAGATAVIQPGGSKRDEEVIAAANDNNLALVMTGMRHFKH